MEYFHLRNSRGGWKIIRFLLAALLIFRNPLHRFHGENSFPQRRSSAWWLQFQADKLVCFSNHLKDGEKDIYVCSVPWFERSVFFFWRTVFALFRHFFVPGKEIFFLHHGSRKPIPINKTWIKSTRRWRICNWFIGCSIRYLPLGLRRPRVFYFRSLIPFMSLEHSLLVNLQ